MKGAQPQSAQKMTEYFADNYVHFWGKRKRKDPFGYLAGRKERNSSEQSESPIPPDAS